jgi:NarL family two-component system response regulator LiaR
MSKRSIRVMVVDDHAVVRHGIRFGLLAFDDLDLVAEAESGEQAVALLAESQPDVVLMDMVMPGMDGVATTRAVLEGFPETEVIALTSFENGTLVQGALQAGAIGYLLKDTAIDELADAIRAAYAGRGTLAPAAVRALAEATTRTPQLGHDLTEREREVLALVVEGMTNLQIAGRLHISLSTARFHVSTILSKLGASNRAEAAALAVKEDLLPETGQSYSSRTE